MASKGENPKFWKRSTPQAALAGLTLLAIFSAPFLMRKQNPLSDSSINDSLSTTDYPIVPQPGCVVIEPNDTVSGAFEKIGETYYERNTFRVIYSQEHGGGQRTFTAESPQQIDEQGVDVWPGDQVCK